MSRTHALSQLDAFFVAYQEEAGIAMQLGAELELDLAVGFDALVEAVADLAQQWPRLGQRVRKRLLGLAWDGEVTVADMVHEGCGTDRIAWRNRTMDPFREPPFQVLLSREGGSHFLAFRAHHAVVDGESFFMLVRRVLFHLAGTASQETVVLDGRDDLADHIPWSKLIGGGHLPSMFRHVRWLVRESKAGRSARLHLRSEQPGDIGICEHTLDAQQTHRLTELARARSVSPAMLTCAAWVRAISRWNREHGSAENACVSLELPVSLRRSRRAIQVGNFISPLLLIADASKPTADIALDLRRQVRSAVRDRDYLAMPTLTSPARYLPWSVFKSTATDTTFSGFATSHFSWFEQDPGMHRALKQGPNGFEVIGQTAYTPVCLHMGAALSVLSWSDQTQLVLTHRAAAIDGSGARQLVDSVAQHALDSA